jgi:hypothetical protein
MLSVSLGFNSKLLDHFPFVFVLGSVLPLATVMSLESYSFSCCWAFRSPGSLVWACWGSPLVAQLGTFGGLGCCVHFVSWFSFSLDLPD